ncbi:cilia- and flagella-associated protein 99-like [Rhopilema esculentum]|uniref:cilia- and flagella-associated protein 99-like n=1 Tax=Rhopilema esculentum TaxID=499914 RepID=UPI0031D25BBE
MDYKRLFDEVVEALEKFKVRDRGIREYITTFVEEKYDKVVKRNDESAVFLTEVFEGCVRFSGALKVVVDRYYKTDGKNCLKSYRNNYNVALYLALFRLDELGISHFRKFMLTQDLKKIVQFLEFVFDELNLKTWMFAEWCKLYEHSYVQIQLLSPILRWLPELHEMLSNLNSRMTGEGKLKGPKPLTALKPFALTKPRPRSVPIPEKIPKLEKHKPAPVSTYKGPKEKEILSKRSEENRKRAEKRLMEASMSQFSCANAEKSEKTKERIRKHIQEVNAKLDFTRHKARSAPSQTGNIPIRLNAAAIMREGALINQKEDDIDKRLTNFAMGGRDASEFMKWQQEMKERDLEEQLAEIERRRLAGKISFEDAILARQNLIKENKQRVSEIKKETREMMDEYLQEKLKKDNEMRNLVQQIMDDAEKTKEAKIKLKEYKKKIVQEVNKESQALMKAALEEAEEEMRQKISLIAKIRAIESVPVMRFKFVDLTESSGAGLLGEMSVAELKERLSLLKVAEKEEEEKKRQEIIQAKVDKDQFLMDTLESIAQRRAEKEKENAKREEERKRQKQRELKDEKVLELQQRLLEKRTERQRESQNQRTRPVRSTRQKELLKEKKNLEELRWSELEKTRERAAKLHSGRTGNSRIISNLQT